MKKVIVLEEGDVPKLVQGVHILESGMNDPKDLITNMTITIYQENCPAVRALIATLKELETV